MARRSFLRSASKVAKKPIVKDCCVKLVRLNRSTIDGYLKPNNITHNVQSEIKGGVLKMGEVTISSDTTTFNVHMKLRSNQITIKPQSCRTNVVEHSLFGKSAQKGVEKSTLTVAVLQPKPIVKLIDEAWRKCKLGHRKELNVDDIVMAKLKGHAAWPALIVEFSSRSKAKVLFFGANPNEKFGFVNMAEIIHFHDAIDVVRLTLKRDFIQKRKFKKGIREVEIVLGMPSFLLEN